MKREETLRVYNSTKEALKIIGDVSRGTFLESTPDPAQNSAPIIDLGDSTLNFKEYAYFKY
jgi:hypothetical protein